MNGVVCAANAWIKWGGIGRRNKIQHKRLDLLRTWYPLSWFYWSQSYIFLFPYAISIIGYNTCFGTNEVAGHEDRRKSSNIWLQPYLHFTLFHIVSALASSNIYSYFGGPITRDARAVGIIRFYTFGFEHINPVQLLSTNMPRVSVLVFIYIHLFCAALFVASIQFDCAN